jgi:uncharacterized protein YdhG (YjbR/CyaY superfamily)
MDDAVRAYIDAIPSEHRPLFDRLHRLVLEAHPEAAVVLSYQMPTYKVGRNRLFLGVWKHGMSVYAWQQGRDAGFTDRHPELRTSKGTIRLRPETAACCGPPWTTAAASHLPCGKLERSSRAWRNGRRAGFRSRWGNPWGFESPRSHTPTNLRLCDPDGPAGRRQAAGCSRFAHEASPEPPPRMRRATWPAACSSRPGRTWL